MPTYAIYRHSKISGRWYLRSCYHPLGEAQRIVDQERQAAIAKGYAGLAVIEHGPYWPESMIKHLDSREIVYS